MRERKLDPASAMFYVGKQTIYHLTGKENVTEPDSRIPVRFPELSSRPLVSASQKVSVSVLNGEQNKSPNAKGKNGNASANSSKSKRLIFGCLGGKEFTAEYRGSVDLSVENSKNTESGGQLRTAGFEGYHLPKVKLSAHLAVVAADKEHEQCHEENEELKINASSQGNGAELLADTPMLAGLSSYEKRKEYGRNMEKNWIKQVQEEKRKKKEACRTSNECKMNSKQIDNLFRSLYSSGSEEEDMAIQPITVGFNNKEDEKDKSVATGDFDTPGNLLRYASLDVLVSGSDQGWSSAQSDVEFLLREGELQQRRVKNKMRKRRQREYIKYLSQLSDPDSDTEEAEKHIKSLEGLTDTELRAVRLKLKKKERETDEDEQEMTNEDLREMARLTLARLKPKHKKKKKSKKQLQREFEAKQARMKEMIKQKFMTDYEKLLSEMNCNKFRRFSMDLTNAEPGFATKTFLMGFHRDMALLNILPGCFSGKFSMFRNLAPSATSLLRFQQLGHIYEKNGEFVIRPHPFVGRRRSDPGVDRPREIRYYKERPHLEAEDINDNVDKKTNKEKKLNKSELRSGQSEEKSRRNSERPGQSQENSRRNSERSESSISDITSESSQRESHAEQKEDVESLQGAKAPMEEAQEEEEKEEEVVISTNIIRRTKSARNLRLLEEEITLYQVLEGINFPSKDIRIQVAMRRIRRQREKRLNRERFGSNAVSDTTEESSIELDDISLPDVEEQKPETARTKRKFITGWGLSNYGGDPPYTKEELDAEIPKLSELFMEMKECRYIRWKRKDQAIINRIFELEMNDITFN